MTSITWVTSPAVNQSQEHGRADVDKAAAVCESTQGGDQNISTIPDVAAPAGPAWSIGPQRGKSRLVAGAVEASLRGDRVRNCLPSCA